jgi:1-acyl-sn-glycerol-3-phosphate acyltransferase
MGGLMDRGYCPLVFPEGRRTPDGRIHPFQSGIGLMALRLGVPVVPVHIGGLFERYSIHHRWPRPGPVRVRFGAPLSFPGEEDYSTVARRVETAIRELAVV